jgi:hypothetical protein
MRSIDRRLSKLEDRLGITPSAPTYLLILLDAGKGFGPAEEAYIKSLDEAGSLPTGGFGVVDVTHIPDRGTATRAPEITVVLV